MFSPWRSGSVTDFFALIASLSSSTILSPSGDRGRGIPPPACPAPQFPHGVRPVLTISSLEESRGTSL